MSYDLAFYGTLRDRDVLLQVTGPDILGAYRRTVQLEGWTAYYVEGAAYPVARPRVGASLTLCLYEGVREQEWSKLLAYEGDDYGWDTWMIRGRAYRYFQSYQELQLSRRTWTLKEFQARQKQAFFQQMKWVNRMTTVHPAE